MINTQWTTSWHLSGQSVKSLLIDINWHLINTPWTCVTVGWESTNFDSYESFDPWPSIDQVSIEYWPSIHRDVNWVLIERSIEGIGSGVLINTRLWMPLVQFFLHNSNYLPAFSTNCFILVTCFERAVSQSKNSLQKVF